MVWKVASKLLMTLMMSVLILASSVQIIAVGASTFREVDEWDNPQGTQIRQDVESMLSWPPLTEWTIPYGGPAYDVPACVRQTSDEGYVMAGVTNSSGAGEFDFWLVRVNASGTMAWNKTYGGAAYDLAASVVQTADGGFAIAGATNSTGAGLFDSWLIRTDADGNVLWQKTYGGLLYDLTTSMVQTADGGYAMAGTSFGLKLMDFWLFKTDANGNMQWSKKYGGWNYDVATSLVRTMDGGYAIVGFTNSTGAGKYDYWLVKTDSSGNMLWSQIYGGMEDDTPSSLVQTSDGGYAIAGYTNSTGAGNHNFWLVRTDSSGILQWSKTYGGTGSERAASLIQTSDGGYVIAGDTNSTGAGGSDFWLVKTDADGNAEWSKTYGGAADDSATSVIPTVDEGYAIAGGTKSYGAGEYDFWLVKVAYLHDVAVTNLIPYKTVVSQGYGVSMNIKVENQGSFTETFNVTLFAGSSPIETLTVTLERGVSTIVSSVWNTVDFAKGTYTISANATHVPNETDIADNTFTDGIVTVTILGDVNGDRKVDSSDLLDSNNAYGSKPSMPNWNPNSDSKGDNQVCVLDLFDLGKNYGKTDP